MFAAANAVSLTNCPSMTATTPWSCGGVVEPRAVVKMYSIMLTESMVTVRVRRHEEKVHLPNAAVANRSGFSGCQIKGL
jgi:hypothetical protein